MTTAGHLVASGALGGVAGGVASVFTSPEVAAIIGLVVFLAYWGIMFIDGDLF